MNSAPNMDDLIAYENEHSALDFKAIQYTRDKHEALLKDVISMANAQVEGPRRIIVGVKLKPDGSRDIVPISRQDVVDDAIYQQLVRENIEPALDLTYEPYEYNGQLVAVFTLSACADQPYMMRKDFGTLTRGACYVRRGSHQFPATRSEMDRMYAARQEANRFSGLVAIGFVNTGYAKEILLPLVERSELPSDRAAAKIARILEKKKSERRQAEQIGGYLGLRALEGIDLNLGFVSIPYEKRSIRTLEENLREVKGSYQEDDLYEILEVRSHKLNLHILNKGTEYLEDASVLLEVQKDDAYMIADSIAPEPDHGSIVARYTAQASIISMHYPTVETRDRIIRVTQYVGDIRHGIPTLAFQEDLRLVLLAPPHDSTIRLKVSLFGKNLATPLVESLVIKVGKDNNQKSEQTPPAYLEGRTDAPSGSAEA